MSKILFTKEQQEQLRRNKYVKKVSDKGITYTDDFKIHAVTENELGKTSAQIFVEAGFDIDVLGNRHQKSLWRWKDKFKHNGELGLRDTRSINSGRPLERELTPEEIIARQEAKIAYLEMELEIQKKFDMIERRALKQISKNTKN